MSQPSNLVPLHHALTGGWPEPELAYLGTGRRPAPSFPRNALPTFWWEYVELAAAAASSPVDYPAVSLLALVSGLLANVRWPRAGAGWTEPPVLRVANVGSPGSSKSPGQEAVLRLVPYLEDAMAEGFEEELAVYEVKKEIANAQIATWKSEMREAIEADGAAPMLRPDVDVPRKPERPRLVIGDVTAQKAARLAAGLLRGYLLKRDELVGWIGSFDQYVGGGSDRAFWLESHQGGRYSVDRVKEEEPIIIPHLSIAVLGGIQPDRLPEIIGGADDGFAARILYAWPDVKPVFRLLREEWDDGVYKEALARLARLEMEPEGEDELGPKQLQLATDAENRLEEFAQEMVRRADQAAGPMAAVLGKARGQVLRLTTVLEFLNWCAGQPGIPEPKDISLGAVKAAICLMQEYFIPMAERVFGDAAIPLKERLAMTVARHLRQEGLRSFNARLLGRTLGRELRDAKVMAEVCELLVEANLIRRRPRGQDRKGGRQALDFEVHPAVFDELPDVSSRRANCANCAETPANADHEEGFGANGAFGTEPRDCAP